MSRRKKYTEMNARELAKATADLDREFIADTFGEPDEEALAQLRRARRKRGRPVRGEGAVRISVTIEKSVLRKADKLAEKTGQTRSQLIERGLRAVLVKTG